MEARGAGTLPRRLALLFGVRLLPWLVNRCCVAFGGVWKGGHQCIALRFGALRLGGLSFPFTKNFQLRTGADKGNSTV